MHLYSVANCDTRHGHVASLLGAWRLGSIPWSALVAPFHVFLVYVRFERGVHAVPSDVFVELADGIGGGDVATFPLNFWRGVELAHVLFGRNVNNLKLSCPLGTRE